MSTWRQSYRRSRAAEWAETRGLGGRPPPFTPPGPLLPDGGGEAELEGPVEGFVGVGQHAAEQPVDLFVVDRHERDPPDQVDVADVVEREVHAVHGAVIRQQPP